MRIVIIGNGIAGVMCAKALRERDPNVEIDIYAEEKHHYYPRPNLIQYLAGAVSRERLYAFPEKWYSDRNINVHQAVPVEKIIPGRKSFLVQKGGKQSYDALVLAAGSHSFLPPIEGIGKKGVFTLWTIDDGERMIEHLVRHKNAVVIGGGLLGLEIARALHLRGAEVTVIEYFERLLPRQLDAAGAALLKRQIEKMGINVRLNSSCQQILGGKSAQGLEFQDGDRLDTDMVVIAAGARPNIKLAADAGLETENGIVVDDYLRTRRKEIFAIGDVCRHKGKSYGIIPAAFEQAGTAASNILGEKKAYKGSIPSNTLKVVGLDVASFGAVNPESGDYEEIRKDDPESGIYKKIVVSGDRIIGAIWMGTRKGASEIGKLVAEGRKIGELKKDLLEDNIDFSELK